MFLNQQFVVMRAPAFQFNNHYTMCSGYEDRKYFAIDEILGSERQNITNKFKWRFWVDNYLCTHAGLFSDYIDPSVKNNEDLNLFFVKEIERANIALRTDQNHWFYFQKAFQLLLANDLCLSA